MKKRNHLLLWLVLFPLLAIAAVYTVVSANQNFSTDIFLTYLSQVQPVWLAAAVGCTLCYIFWEGLSLAYHLPPLGQPLTPGARRRLVCSGYFLLCRHPLCNRWTAGLRLVHASGRCAGLCLLRSAASESGSLHPVHSGHRAHCHCTVPRGFGHLLPSGSLVHCGGGSSAAGFGRTVSSASGPPGPGGADCALVPGPPEPGSTAPPGGTVAGCLGQEDARIPSLYSGLAPGLAATGSCFLLQPPAKAVPSSGAGVPSFGLGRIPRAGAPCSGPSRPASSWAPTPRLCQAPWVWQISSSWTATAI